MPIKKFPIDSLRTICWYEAVRARLGVKSAYQISEWFNGYKNDKTSSGLAGRVSDWSKYRSGNHRPTRPRLEFVDRGLPGTKEVFLLGPDGQSLWAAIGSESKVVLGSILRICNGVDKQIAKIRLDAIEGRLRNHPGVGYSLVTFDSKELLRVTLPDIWRGLLEILDENTAQVALDFVVMSLKAEIERWQMDFIMDSRYHINDTEELILDSACMDIAYSPFDELDAAVKYNAELYFVRSVFVADKEQ